MFCTIFSYPDNYKKLIMTARKDDNSPSQEGQSSVTVKYFAIMREITGMKEEIIVLGPRITIEQAIKKIAQTHGSKLEEFVFRDDRLREGLTILVNGQTVEEDKFGLVVLKGGDEIVILPPIGGGSQ